MATRGAQFTAIPNVPQTGLSNWQFFFLNALKQNTELLAGINSGGSSASAAVLKGQVTVSTPRPQNMTRTTAQGAGFLVNNVNVPSLDDYNQLIANVNTLAQDVASLRGTVEALITQLRN